MTTNAPPSQDPAGQDVLTGAMLELYRKLLQSTDDMLPARIVSYDRASNRAQVQIQVLVTTTLRQQIPRGLLASIPVFQFGGGGFFMSFNLQPGDWGWIKASDRDISLVLQAGEAAGAGSKRLHTFSDGLFLPDILRDYTIASEDLSSVVIQSRDGSVKISLNDERIKIKAPLVEIDAANTTTTGAFHADGLITSDTDVAVGPITLTTHRTSGVTTGMGTSTGPVP